MLLKNFTVIRSAPKNINKTDTKAFNKIVKHEIPYTIYVFCAAFKKILYDIPIKYCANVDILIAITRKKVDIQS